jgi:hypothetical protein
METSCGKPNAKRLPRNFSVKRTYYETSKRLVLFCSAFYKIAVVPLFSAERYDYGSTKIVFEVAMCMNNNPNETVELFRPIGQAELELIKETGYIRFPKRLFHQPIFYPILNREYAEAIAKKWNTKDAASGFVGYVTKFSVRREFISKYPVQTAGAQAIHQEYWIPAEELEEFNDNIVGLIEVVAEFRGAEKSIEK